MKKMNYDEALNKLRTIVEEIENNQLSISELTQKVKEAKQMTTLCKNHLNGIQAEIDDIFSEDK